MVAILSRVQSAEEDRLVVSLCKRSGRSGDISSRYFGTRHQSAATALAILTGILAACEYAVAAITTTDR